mmetsp:Transcript_10460/g.25592  ORF Transcript_10460/g.25592 Transcript_10460/m.25592 type:complete len:226 (-) Transcript_10460:118-795(-)
MTTTRLALPVTNVSMLLWNSSWSARGIEATGWVDEAPLVIEEPSDCFVATDPGARAHRSCTTHHGTHGICGDWSHPCFLCILHGGGEELLLPSRVFRVTLTAAATAAALLVLLVLLFVLPPGLLAAAAAAVAVTVTAAAGPLLSGPRSGPRPVPTTAFTRIVIFFLYSVASAFYLLGAFLLLLLLDLDLHLLRLLTLSAHGYFSPLETIICFVYLSGVWRATLPL